jgi:hypothetical protein
MKQLYRDAEDRRQVYEEVERFTRNALAYIKSRPKSKSPLAGLTFDDAKLNPAEAYRVAAELPGPVQAELRRLRAEHADDPEVLDALLEWNGATIHAHLRVATLRSEHKKHASLRANVKRQCCTGGCGTVTSSLMSTRLSRAASRTDIDGGEIQRLRRAGVLSPPSRVRRDGSRLRLLMRVAAGGNALNRTPLGRW